jgi:glycosyltransferase involved in cell wall biosynthesis
MPTRPIVSFVVTVKDGQPFLADFISAYDAQATGDAEVVVVDRGSSDGSTEVITAWAERSPDSVRIVESEGPTLSEARNTGIKAARGQWISFPRSMDRFGPGYVAAMLATVAKTKADAVVALRREWYSDSGSLKPHRLAEMHWKSHTADLSKLPQYFIQACNAVWLRTDRIKSSGLEFDPQVEPVFNEGHFLARYLLQTPNPTVRYEADAVFHQRRRPDWLPMDPDLWDPRRFTQVPEAGYLAILRSAKAQYGEIPGWLKSLVLFELTVYFERDQRASRSPKVQSGEMSDRFCATLAEIASEIGESAAFRVQQFTLMTPEARQAMFYGIPGKAYLTPYAVYDRVDHPRKAIRIWFRYTGDEPDWEIRDREGVVTPLAGKVRDVEYFGKIALQKRIVWVPLRNQLTVWVNGNPLPLVPAEPDGSPQTAGELTAAYDAVHAPPSRLPLLSRPYKGKRLREIVVARLPWNRKRYHQAWVVMDRLSDADDNGERLFEYLHRQRPDINAWFVLDPTSPDWERLQRAYGKRLVAYGTPRWKNLMAHCINMVSSHLATPMSNPKAMRNLPHRDWKFTFLQHGVIKDDLSLWLNSKRMDLIVVSTPAEFASLAAEHSRYDFTERDVALVGLARFDRLQRVASECPDPDLVLVAPTWREALTQRGEGLKSVAPGFEDSDFVKNWLGLLNDPDFLAAAKAAGKKVGFLPHPNLQSALPGLPIPDEVEVLTFAGQDVQRFFARAALMVTDYSSMAFNSAYLDRPVVYFQFDRDEFFAGAHTSRPGYFDFERDGFGPVTQTISDTTSAVRTLLGGTPGEYVERMAATFPARDGKCCERTVAAIEALWKK